MLQLDRRETPEGDDVILYTEGAGDRHIVGRLLWEDFLRAVCELSAAGDDAERREQAREWMG